MLHWWLLDNPEEVSRILDDVHMTIDFLQQKEIIHFDAHFRNFLTDGEHIYLTDFGLLLDKSCLRDENEQDFFNRHTYYDYGSAVSCLSDLIFDIFEALPEDAQQQLKNTYGADPLILPITVLPEVTYLLGSRLGHDTMRQFLKRLVTSNVILEAITVTDLERATEILDTCADSRLDFVDSTIVAIAG